MPRSIVAYGGSHIIHANPEGELTIEPYIKKNKAKFHIFFHDGYWHVIYRRFAAKEKTLRDLAKWWPMLDWSL